MGTFYYPIRVGRLDGSAFETIEALVDTGATWTWIPRPLLDRLDIPVADRRELQMANGQIAERESGWALITADGVTVPSICIFGDPDSIPLLGAVTLEECSLAPDPVRHRLVRVVGLALSGARR
ncbi:MAG: retroviral-like aspartic protease family protein [bacterium]